MRASALEFRLRMAIHAIIIVLGFWAPWIDALGIGRRISLLEWLALETSRAGILSFAAATPVLIVLAALIAALGAVLRLWGTAYLGAATVQHLDMKAGALMADGPYRYVRNPLYLGLWLMVLALAFMMPPTGALVSLVLITLFEIRLILGEEAFLSAQFGEPYQAYLRSIPRIIPRMRSPLPRSGAKPHWLLAIPAEIMPIGVFVTLAAFSWSYNNRLMGRAILVTFGISLVVRALLPQKEATPAG